MKLQFKGVCIVDINLVQQCMQHHCGFADPPAIRSRRVPSDPLAHSSSESCRGTTLTPLDSNLFGFCPIFPPTPRKNNKHKKQPPGPMGHVLMFGLGQKRPAVFGRSWWVSVTGDRFGLPNPHVFWSSEQKEKENKTRGLHCALPSPPWQAPEPSIDASVAPRCPRGAPGRSRGFLERHSLSDRAEGPRGAERTDFRTKLDESSLWGRDWKN